jgi:hypothetical protein
MKYCRIYADQSGDSHFEDVEVHLTPTDFAPPAPPVNISPFSPASRYAFGIFPTGWRDDRHHTPQRQIFFILSGKCEIRVSDGEVRRFQAGGVILAEDTTGKGHASRVTSKTDLLTAVVQLSN